MKCIEKNIKIIPKSKKNIKERIIRFKKQKKKEKVLTKYFLKKR